MSTFEELCSTRGLPATPPTKDRVQDTRVTSIIFFSSQVPPPGRNATHSHGQGGWDKSTKFREKFVRLDDSVPHVTKGDALPPTHISTIGWKGRVQGRIGVVPNRASNLSNLNIRLLTSLESGAPNPPSSGS